MKTCFYSPSWTELSSLRPSWIDNEWRTSWRTGALVINSRLPFDGGVEGWVSLQLALLSRWNRNGTHCTCLFSLLRLYFLCIWNFSYSSITSRVLFFLDTIAKSNRQGIVKNSFSEKDEKRKKKKKKKEKDADFSNSMIDSLSLCMFEQAGVSASFLIRFYKWRECVDGLPRAGSSHVKIHHPVLDSPSNMTWL